MKLYGSEAVKPESIVLLDANLERGRGVREVEIITLRAIKGLIWGFYSPSPWMVWLRVAALPYGVEITRFGHLAWWKRYCIKVLRATD